MAAYEIPLFPADVMRLLGITHPNTLRVMIKTGRIPPPDVQLTKKTRYWHRTTLEKVGLLQSESQVEK